MDNFFFWRSWPGEYRRMWFAMAALFVFALGFLWFSYLHGAGGVIHWDTIQEQKKVETNVHSFALGPFTLNVPAEMYVVFEYFTGSAIEPNTTASYTFLVLLAISAALLMAVLSTLRGFWFYAAMGLAILFVAGMRLEVLGLFGLFNRVPVVVALLLYVAPAFYFNRLRPATPFVLRVAAFLAVTALIGTVAAFASQVEFPFYHLALTGYTPALILTVLFILMIAHELFAAFIYLVGRGDSKSLRHFAWISAIYLLNLFITALHEMGTIEWNFIYINLYLLLTLSALAGIWGFRAREPLYGDAFPFQPFGAYLFLAMGIICFATTGQLLGNANDPALRIVRHAVIYSHTGYGLIFLTYVVSNFILMMARNIAVYPVLYKPNRMPYFTYRFAGTIATLAFIFLSGWQSYIYDGMAGFYNTAGDMYTLMGNAVYAESFYDQGRAYGFNNNRSNYALGDMKAKRFAFEAAHEHYRAANQRRPTAYSLTNAGNIYLWESEVFQAIQAYQRGIRSMPGAMPLYNNLGFAYAKVHNLDSALAYFDQARDNDFTRDAAETNFFGMAAMELLPFKTDSVLNVFGTTSAGTVANALALAKLYNQPLQTGADPLRNRTLTLHDATLLNNYIIKNVKSLDTAFTRRALHIASDSLNFGYSEALKASLAFAYYHQGNVAQGLQLLAEQVYLSQSYGGKFNYVMGLWALEQGNPEKAASYFQYADTQNYKDSPFYTAIALTEARDVDEALAAWDSVAAGDDENERMIAAQMKRLLTLPPTEAMVLADAEKYQYSRYRTSLSDTLEFDRLVNSFRDANYKAQALLDYSQRLFRAGLVARAIRYFNRVAGLELTDTRLYNDIRHFELRMLASRGEARALANQINKGVEFDASRTLDKMLYTALLAEVAGDTVKAESHYRLLGAYNPYFEEGILAAAAYYRLHQPGTMAAYTILSEAIHVNPNSYRLQQAYAAEAWRKGLDNYAAEAEQEALRLQVILMR